MDEAWIADRTSIVALHDGTKVMLRPIVPDDKAELRRAFDHLSEESR